MQIIEAYLTNVEFTNPEMQEHPFSKEITPGKVALVFTALDGKQHTIEYYRSECPISDDELNRRFMNKELFRINIELQ
jgi:hypothetical protein